MVVDNHRDHHLLLCRLLAGAVVLFGTGTFLLLSAVDVGLDKFCRSI